LEKLKDAYRLKDNEQKRIKMFSLITERYKTYLKAKKDLDKEILQYETELVKLLSSELEKTKKDLVDEIALGLAPEKGKTKKGKGRRHGGC
jgi:hypothetical protein